MRASMTIEWTIILLLYGVGWLFERCERREIALQICALSYLSCVLLVRFPEYNFNIPYLGYAVINFIGLMSLIMYGFRSLSWLFLSSLILHTIAAAAYLISFNSFFAIYSPIILILNMGILAVLCVGSTGFNLVFQFLGSHVCILCDKSARSRMARIQNQLYNTQLLKDIEKDFV